MSDETLDYKGTLAYTQQIRREIIAKRMERGVPDDNKDAELVLKALKDMDQTAIQDRRNSIDETNADSAREVAAAMQEFIGMQMNRNPFQRDPETGEVPPLPSLDKEKLGSFNLVEGEKEIGTIQENADDFIARMQSKSREDDDE